MSNPRKITCPRCGGAVHIPVIWIMGVEGIFRCKSCSQPFKTGYRMGALLFGLAFGLAVASVQLLVYLFSAYTLWFFLLWLIPLWFLYGFFLRRTWLVRRARRRVNRKPSDTDAVP